jgi:hypothetical protein
MKKMKAGEREKRKGKKKGARCEKFISVRKEVMPRVPTRA